MSKTDKNSPAAKKETTTNKPINVGITALFIFISIAFSGSLYLLWEELQQSNLKQLLTMQQIEALTEQQTTATALSQDEIKKINSYQENLHNNLTNLIRNKEHLRNDWLMAEAEYLVQLANHRLLLEKDVTTAAVALKAADARLAEVADPALLSVRKILLQDLHVLNNIPNIDLAGLSVTLSALSNNIRNLPLRTPSPNNPKNNVVEESTTSKEIKNLSELPAAVWQDIKNLIVIRNHIEPLEPLLAPKQHFFLVQNLSLLLEQSRLALLNSNNEIYQERLSTTIKWIKKYFDSEHNVTRNMLASLEELQKLDIDPTLPNISSTYSAIKKYRTQGIKPLLPVEKVESKP